MGEGRLGMRLRQGKESECELCMVEWYDMVDKGVLESERSLMIQLPSMSVVLPYCSETKDLVQLCVRNL